MFKLVRNSLVSLLSPQACGVCSLDVDNIDNGVACTACWTDTRIFTLDNGLCPKCGAYFRSTAVQPVPNCGKCSEHDYDRAAAVGVYEKALAATIIHLKSNPVLGRRAQTAMIDRFASSGLLTPDLIIPIPLSRRRKLERGFNQADVIGQVLGRNCGITVDSLSLARKSDSPIHRVAMDMKARELTVRNAFEVRRPKLIDGRSILLVDDVFTSGSTSSYCAKALKKSGATKVNVLTLARAISD